MRHLTAISPRLAAAALWSTLAAMSEEVKDTAALIEAAERWRDEDPDTETQEELAKLLDAQDIGAIQQRFGGRLQFGTAGLRGVMGAGPMRMNELVIARATAGLCAWVKSEVPDATNRGICIGYDGRIKSKRFAEAAAEIAAGFGYRVYLFDRRVATPVLAFAVLDRGAAAGIMVTASHNPPAYNGYKVYWENGAQIIPPHDKGISDAIDRIDAYSDIPRTPLADALAQGDCIHLGDELEERYLSGVEALPPNASLPRDFSIAYTALHGVGNRFALEALRRTGVARVHSVASQAEPDGRFPTVDFPNPEEDGAMDAVFSLAKDVDADLIAANDPDADRLAVAVPHEGGYRQLSGNEIGCLLGHYLLEVGDPSIKRTVISTVVSSPMLGAIAAEHGAHWEPTLTGFKWIANRGLELERTDGLNFVFGYEEALGYTVGSLVRDKDGIGALVVFADMLAWCRSRGVTILEELEACWRRYGMYLSRPVAIVLPGADGARQIQSILGKVRENPPSALDGHLVVHVDDLLHSTRTFADGTQEALAYPPSNVLILDLGSQGRVMLRPSGTEPKIKYYFDVRIDPSDHSDFGAARTAGETFIDGLSSALDSIIGEGGPGNAA